MMRIRFLSLIGASIAALSQTTFAAEEATQLLRYPTIQGNQVIFTYAGDLWRTDLPDLTAKRLTSDPGVERSAKISPDGKWVAFTGQLHGEDQVYVMPTKGGSAKQLTFYPTAGELPPRWGFDHRVVGWTNDSQHVLFWSMRDGKPSQSHRLFKVSIDGGLPEALAPKQAGTGTLSPDNSGLAFNHYARDFRTWKRYSGGWSQDVYALSLETNKVRQLTTHPRTDRDPMWLKNGIYFVSDRNGTLNLYKFSNDALKTKKPKPEQLTDFDHYDVRFASTDGESQIIFEHGGILTHFDSETGDVTPLKIHVPDDGRYLKRKIVDIANHVSDGVLSPNGEQLFISGRGDIFSTAIKKGGKVTNWTKESHFRERALDIAETGDWIIFVSDQDGEENLYKKSLKAGAKAEQLTEFAGSTLKQIKINKPGTHVAFTDRKGRVQVLDIANKQIIFKSEPKYGSSFGDHTFSADGRYLAFSMEPQSRRHETKKQQITVFDTKTNESHTLGSPLFSEFSPTFSLDGKYLFFLSDRGFAGQIGEFDWNFIVHETTGVYAYALQGDVKNPFAPVAAAFADEASDDKETDDEIQAIDWKNLDQRVIRLPVEKGSYSGLTATKSGLIYLSNEEIWYAGNSSRKAAIYRFDFEEKAPKVMLEDVLGYTSINATRDGEWLLIRQGKKWQRIKHNGASDNLKTADLSDVKLEVSPKLEWQVAFKEAWRRYRDHFYARNMHGYDWEALGEKYEVLLPYAAHRSDLNYLIGEMISELNVSHAYVQGGDLPKNTAPNAGLLGATFKVSKDDPTRYAFDVIYQGHNQETKYRAPLTEVTSTGSVQVQSGDILLAINGETLTTDDNPYRLLSQVGEKSVELTIQSQNKTETILVKPVKSEESLRYLDWTTKRNQYALEKSGGKIGYFHIPDMLFDGMYEFTKWFYPQIDKPALIVDVRNNGGGNISEMLIERLSRKPVAYSFSRNNGAQQSPAITPFSHKVALMDGVSCSDGDIFPYRFKAANLGPVIGVKSWGGVIGITGANLDLIDGGKVYVPEFGFADANGEHVIESVGVDPDIWVKNDPESLIKGEDKQLDAAIKHLLAKLAEDPKQYPAKPEDPVRTK